MNKPVSSRYFFIRQWVLLAILSLPTAGHAQEQSGQNYTLTRQYGSVLFRVLHQQYLNLVGRFDEYSGSLYLDLSKLENSRLDATVAMASLDMSDADVVETLVNSSTWFNASLYPEASFTTTAVEVTGANTLDFIGQLTFVGRSRPWTIHAELLGGADGTLEGSTIGMIATGTFDRTQFGLDQYLNMAAEAVTIEINVKFNRD